MSNINDSRYKKHLSPELSDWLKDSRMARIAMAGAISELEAYIYIKSHLGEDWSLVHNKDGGADFTVTNIRTDQVIKIEAKRTGTGKVDFQRAIREKQEVRLYEYDFCDVICVDMYDVTGIENDYRFINTSSLPNHNKLTHKVKPSIIVEGNSTSLKASIKKLQK